MWKRLVLLFALLPGVALADAGTAQPLARPFPAGVTPPGVAGSPTRCGNSPHDVSDAGHSAPQMATKLQFIIAADGSVQDVAVAQSSGMKALDKAAADCVARWRYTPATENGTPVAVQWDAIVQWTMR